MNSTDGNTSADSKASLPVWDLTRLFPSKDAPEFLNTLADIEDKSVRFSKKYSGHITKLTGAALGVALQEYAAIQKEIVRIRGYARALAIQDINQEPFLEETQETLSKVDNALLFVVSEIEDLSEEDLLRKMMDPALTPYGAWIGRMRALRSHNLSDEAEKYLKKKMTVGEDAWRKVYDEAISSLQVNIGDKLLHIIEAAGLIQSSADEAVRREAYESIANALGRQKKTFSLALNTLIQLKEADDERRGFEIPEDSAQLNFNINSDTVQELLDVVEKNAPSLSQRFYAAKARSAKVHPADLEFLPSLSPQKKYTWDEARDIVIEVASSVSVDLGNSARALFDQKRIQIADATEEPDIIDAGGFCYILAPFQGTAENILDLARLIGKAVAQEHASQRNILQRVELSPAIAIISGRFFENLVIQKMITLETDPGAKKSMFAWTLDKSIRDIFNPMAVFSFEQKLYDRVLKKGEVTADQISRMWKETQRDILGPSVDLDTSGAPQMWMADSHLIHAPFAGHGEAVSNAMGDTLLETYTSSEDKAVFAQKYMTFLKQGNEMGVENALAIFGLNPETAAFWKKGFSLFSRQLDEYAPETVPVSPSKPPKPGK